jgi:uncharacterized protein YcbK (DUF882 family)
MIDFSKVKFFKASEFFGDADKMSPQLIFALDHLRAIVNRPIKINSAYRAEDPGSTHKSGLAVDIVISGLSLMDQYLVAEKTGLFAGIGLYPYWATPGLHLDVRKLKKGELGKRWIRDRKDNYIALNADNLKRCGI